MGRRSTVVEAVNKGNVTYITLSPCRHQRSLGGHVLNGLVRTPSSMLGQEYICEEGPCGRSKEA